MTRTEQYIKDLELSGNTESDILFGLENGTIDRPEWLIVKETNDGAILSDHDNRMSPEITLTYDMYPPAPEDEDEVTYR